MTDLEKQVIERTHELQAAMEDVRRASQAKFEFLDNLSHEISAPMNSVIGIAELMLESNLDANQRMYAEIIQQSGHSLLETINDVFDFSKAESGCSEIREENFDLQNVIEDVATQISARAMDKLVEVATRYNPQLPTCFYGDGRKIRKIISNIIGNAVKFTDEGFILIDVDGVRNKETVDLQIMVQDTGIGISPENIDRINHPFGQTDDVSSPECICSGLGLAIANRFVELMGGTIEISSEHGKGSIFTVHLSLPVPRSSLPPGHRGMENFGKTILVVTDSEVSQQVLLERLVSWGMSVQVADCSTQALEMMQQATVTGHRIDMALIDQQLSTMDGVVLGMKMRSDPAHSDIPVILLSSVAQQAEAKNLSNHEFTAYLTKPVRTSLLLDALLTVPGSNKAGANVKADAASSIAGKLPLRLLVAEDSFAYQLVFKHFLKDRDIELHMANSAHMAVQMFEEIVPDLVLMDMKMSDTDGCKAAARIRIHESARRLGRCPIIALVANAAQDDSEFQVSAELDDILAKPIVRLSLLQMIDKWFPNKFSPAQAI